MVSPALFPAGTLAVNVIGCLAIGALAGFADAQEGLNAQTRLFLLVGALGGFTTFSAFGLETFSLFRDGFDIRALVNIVVQVTVSLAAVAGGFMLSRGGLWS